MEAVRCGRSCELQSPIITASSSKLIPNDSVDKSVSSPFPSCALTHISISKRPKWAPFFDDGDTTPLTCLYREFYANIFAATAIIFLVPVSAFDQVCLRNNLAPSVSHGLLLVPRRRSKNEQNGRFAPALYCHRLKPAPEEGSFGASPQQGAASAICNLVSSDSRASRRTC